MSGQLSYAIADGVASSRQGGWGIVEIVGALSPAAQEALVRGRTVSLPQRATPFMSNAELAARPVRWRVVPSALAEPPALLAWHSVEAGSDSTGRPGNVFTHAAELPVTRPTRPMDWAFSADWLSPYGVTEVSQARLPQRLGPPLVQLPFLAWLHGDTSMSLADVESTVSRTLPALVDGRQVVLVVPNNRDPIGLLDFISWLLPFDRSTQMRWATHEDSVSATDLVEQGFDVVTVERADHVPRTATSGASGAPVIVDTAQVEEGDVAWLEVVRKLRGLDPGALRELLVARDSDPLAEVDPLAVLRRLVGLPPVEPKPPASPASPKVHRIGMTETDGDRPGAGQARHAGVALLKDPVSVRDPVGTQPLTIEPAPTSTDPLVEFALPSPASAIAAHAVLAERGHSYSKLVDPADWTRVLPRLSPRERLAVAHIAAQDREIVTSVERSFATVVGDDGFADLMRGPVLVTIARAELTTDAASPTTVPNPLAVERLRSYVAGFDAYDLIPFAFQFSRLRDIVDQIALGDIGASHQRLLNGRLGLGASSVWLMVTRDGTLGNVVPSLLRQLRGTH